LRDYGHARQIGLEDTPEAYVARMVEVFREVRRVLRDDGTLWLNLGDSYARTGGWASNDGLDGCARGESGRAKTNVQAGRNGQKRPSGLKEKDLVGIPWRVAFALQADGWWLRQDIIWHKPNPMPESVRDRCTKAHEYVFLLSKSERYYYDAEAVKEAFADERQGKSGAYKRRMETVNPYGRQNAEMPVSETGHNRRSVWTITTKPYSGAHFAVMPPDLVQPCILAGCPEGGTVLDPFAGSGTTLAVAAELGRNGIGCELNSQYVTLAIERIKPQLAANRWPLLHQLGEDDEPADSI
jgi:site-specific DNA-methyltransferase (adenine-specific)